MTIYKITACHGCGRCEVSMFGQNFHFLFSRPKTYFGAFQDIEETEEMEDFETESSFIFGIESKHGIEQIPGLYLHWKSE